MKGYWNNPEATANTIRDGWLWTGDMGALDQDGFLTMHDRSKDMIISGGSNIYPREVEEVLLTHPDVAEVAVIGRAHEEWGEVVVACVVVKAGQQQLDLAALDALCIDNIARFKRPKNYVVMQALPKNNYGKVIKTGLPDGCPGLGSERAGVMLDFNSLIYQVTDQVGLITFNRPEVRNALELQMRDELAQLVSIVRDDKDLRALVLTDAGGAFCAGGDLKGRGAQEQPAQDNRARMAKLHSWFIAFCNLELPVIAAVDGPAYGAGFNLALGCDLILASPAARFCAVFGRIGLVPDLSGLYLLPRLAGMQRVK